MPDAEGSHDDAANNFLQFGSPFVGPSEVDHSKPYAVVHVQRLTARLRAAEAHRRMKGRIRAQTGAQIN
jgi:hypothetical protein